LLVRRKLLVIDLRDFDVQIDPIQPDEVNNGTVARGRQRNRRDIGSGRKREGI
jgi:hypothetical protein